MTTMEILLVIIAILLAILIILAYGLTYKKNKEIVATPSSIDSMVTLYTKIDELSKDLKNQTNGMNDTLNKRMGEIVTYTSDIRQTHKSIEQMLRIPKERASFGEINLEYILADQLPPDMFGIRKKILNGKIPDAYIKSTVGLICIDARFPLDNYIKMNEVMNEVIDTNKEENKQNYKKQFIKDVDVHLLEVAKNYIDIQKGSAEFAFAYIPAESVYYFLVTEAYDMLKDYTKKGVQVVSPLTLYYKIELIKTGVHARKLSEDAEKVRYNIINLSKAFRDIDDTWRILYDVHLRNATKKAEEVDKAYKNIREEFDKVSKLGDI